ncbi:hypothetical protein F5888DRAFT_1805235 [Russula emetica]|nr:hypothetical protein F5888DRAFT_1805235 [Russula emetica]
MAMVQTPSPCLSLSVDRRTTRRSPPRDELRSYPWRSTRSTTADSEMPEEESTAKKEVSWRIRDRWLSNADDEPSVGPNGPDEKDKVLGDEFHPKYLLKGMSLYQEDDHQQLTTDPTIYTPSSDGRLFGFLPYRTGIAPAFHRDAIIVSPPVWTRQLELSCARSGCLFLSFWGVEARAASSLVH